MTSTIRLATSVRSTKVEDTDDDIRGWGLGDMKDKFIELDEKFQHKRRKPDNQAQQKRCDQPSAVEDDRFDKMPRVALEPPVLWRL